MTIQVHFLYSMLSHAICNNQNAVYIFYVVWCSVTIKVQFIYSVVSVKFFHSQCESTRTSTHTHTHTRVHARTQTHPHTVTHIQTYKHTFARNSLYSNAHQGEGSLVWRFIGDVDDYDDDDDDDDHDDGDDANDDGDDVNIDEFTDLHNAITWKTRATAWRRICKSRQICREHLLSLRIFNGKCLDIH